MRTEDIRDQLESLRSEVRNMGRSLHRIREDDIRWVFCEQIRPILMEKVRRLFDEIKRTSHLKDVVTISRLESSVYDLVERTISIFQRFDEERAIDVVEKGSKEIAQRFDLESHERVNDAMNEIVTQLKDYFQTFSTLDKQVDIGPGFEDVKKGMVHKPITPKMVEDLLSPLASAVRIELMTALRGRERGLTELSKLLGLQKGHLQFHVKILVDSGYVGTDKRTRQYSLTDKGDNAFVGVETFIRQLGGQSRI